MYLSTLKEVKYMSFSEALVKAHSTEQNKAALIADVLDLLNIWDEIESLPEGSKQQREWMEVARTCVDSLRNTWNLTTGEIGDLDDHSDEFREAFSSPASSGHEQAC